MRNQFVNGATHLHSSRPFSSELFSLHYINRDMRKIARQYNDGTGHELTIHQNPIYGFSFAASFMCAMTIFSYSSRFFSPPRMVSIAQASKMRDGM